MSKTYKTATKLYRVWNKRAAEIRETASKALASRIIFELLEEGERPEDIQISMCFARFSKGVFQCYLIPDYRVEVDGNVFNGYIEKPDNLACEYALNGVPVVECEPIEERMMGE